jgi:hypothetical protein
MNSRKKFCTRAKKSGTLNCRTENIVQMDLTPSEQQPKKFSADSVIFSR